MVKNDYSKDENRLNFRNSHILFKKCLKLWQLRV
jgi:hypothetical protein